VCGEHLVLSESVFVAQFLYLRRFLVDDLTALFAPDGLRVVLKDKERDGDGPFVCFYADYAMVPKPSREYLHRKLIDFIQERVVVAEEEATVTGVTKVELSSNSVLKCAQDTHRVVMLVSRVPQQAAGRGATVRRPGRDADASVSVMCVGMDVPVTWTADDVTEFVGKRYRTLGIALHTTATVVQGARDARHIFTRATLQLDTAVMTAPELRNVLRAMDADSKRVPEVVFPQIRGREHAGRVFAKFHVSPADMAAATQVPHAVSLDVACVRMTVPAAWDYRAVRCYIRTVPQLSDAPVHHIAVNPSPDGTHNIADVVLDTKRSDFEMRRDIMLSILKTEPLLRSPQEVQATVDEAGSASCAPRSLPVDVCQWVAYGWRQRDGSAAERGAHSTHVLSSTSAAPLCESRLRVQFVHEAGKPGSASAVLEEMCKQYQGSDVECRAFRGHFAPRSRRIASETRSCA
jgi:hypothetical protein